VFCLVVRLALLVRLLLLSFFPPPYTPALYTLSLHDALPICCTCSLPTPCSSNPTFSPGSALSLSLRDLSTPVIVALATSWPARCTATGCPIRSVPPATAPGATTPRPVMANTSSTVSIGVPDDAVGAGAPGSAGGAAAAGVSAAGANRGSSMGSEVFFLRQNTGARYQSADGGASPWSSSSPRAWVPMAASAAWSSLPPSRTAAKLIAQARARRQVASSAPVAAAYRSTNSARPVAV